MSATDKLTKYKKQMEEAKAEKERATGALEKLQEQLKSKFGCKSLKEAQAKLAEMKKNAAKLDKEIEEMIEAFEEKYADVLS